MKIEINLEATASINIHVTDGILASVMQDYKGDFKRWAKDNYSEFVDFDDFDVDFDGCYFNKDEASELFKNSIEKLRLDENFNISKSFVFEKMLNRSHCDAPTVEDELEEFILDADLVSKALDFVDTDNKKKLELNYILFNKNSISATDTKKLIHITNHKYSFDDVLFPPHFIKPMQDGGKCYVKNNDEFVLNYNNYWFRIK